MKFSITDFFNKCDQIRKKLTEEILNGKLHFLCSDHNEIGSEISAAYDKNLLCCKGWKLVPERNLFIFSRLWLLT